LKNGTYPSGVAFWDGYLAEVNFIDGQALTPADFGETGDYGEWKPIEYSGTYGTNGFYLPFKQDYTVEGFSATTYPGNGTTGHTIGGVGFSPDLLWLKERTNTSQHRLFDTVRGASKRLVSDDTSAEATDTSNMTSFNTDGFTLGNSGSVNASGDRYIAWSWDMGGSNASNTNGSITSTVRANPTYGQSIVSYVGTGSNATVGHGLSSAPEMMIVKRRDNAQDWAVYHTGLGSATKNLYLNLASSVQTEAPMWNSTAPTNSVFSVGTYNHVNNASENYIAYCFHSVTGYSKFGSYAGTGSSGNAITTGFKPAFVMVKRTDSANSWCMYDSLRDDYLLLADASDAEVSVNHLDFTDTGFTIQSTGGGQNASGGTYIYMAFADKREYAYWLDQSGNNNDWTSNNLTESDISVDSPTNNFATYNPLVNTTYNPTLSEGNLKSQFSTSGYWHLSCSSHIISSGKYYYEFLATGSTYFTGVIFDDGTFNYKLSPYTYAQDGMVMILGEDENSRIDNSSVSGTNIGGTANGDIVGVAIDMEAGTLKCYKNNVYKFALDMTTSNHWGVPAIVASVQHSNSGAYHIINFGQDSSFAGNKTAQGNQDSNDIGDFYYTPPTGFLALCTKNLPDVDVVPSEHFNTVLYSGTGSNQDITGVGFSPAFVWAKDRTLAHSHMLTDKVRGIYKTINSNSTESESSLVTALRSFNSDGFSVGSNANINDNGSNYVAWNWKANGSGSSNTDGDITSTVSANVDAGFSIVSYSGATNATVDSSNNSGNYWTIGHGLSEAPELIIAKNRGSGGWYVGSDSLGSTPWTSGSHLVLNSTAATANNANMLWGNAAPNSSTFKVGGWDVINRNGNTYIAYCFHSVDGYSKVGSYTGNNNADGTFVYTGFRPAYVMVKRVTSANSYSFWLIYDSARNTYNQVSNKLGANSSLEENNPDYIGTSGANDIDFISNGFKLRASNSGSNSTSDYIYLAFAETPFKYSNAR